jgi:hypothetical protein
LYGFSAESLADFIMNLKPNQISKREAFALVHGLLTAVQYLHQKKILYLLWTGLLMEHVEFIYRHCYELKAVKTHATLLDERQ